MPIPNYQDIMLPLLKFAEDSNEHTFSESVDFLAEHFQLTSEERDHRLPSRAQPLFNSRVGWAKTYLTRAVLLESVRHGVFRITERGRELLNSNPSKITSISLRQYPEFLAFVAPTVDASGLVAVEHTIATQQIDDQISNQIESSNLTIEELLYSSYKQLHKELAQELLLKVINNTPQFFEQLVVDLLLRLGYGGAVSDAGTVTQLTRDGGIDGFIKEDKLGLDLIGIQAKRYTDKSVSEKEINEFIGALTRRRVKKGVFITTSQFTPPAISAIKELIDINIVLINGEQLVNYMISYNLGVSIVDTLYQKRIDTDYFDV